MTEHVSIGDSRTTATIGNNGRGNHGTNYNRSNRRRYLQCGIRDHRAKPEMEKQFCCSGYIEHCWETFEHFQGEMMDEMLIRIDERLKELSNNVQHIKDTLDLANCGGKEERIKTLEKSMERRVKFEIAFWPSILTAGGTVVGAAALICRELKGS